MKNHDLVVVHDSMRQWGQRNCANLRINPRFSSPEGCCMPQRIKRELGLTVCLDKFTQQRWFPCDPFAWLARSSWAFKWPIRLGHCHTRLTFEPLSKVRFFLIADDEQLRELFSFKSLTPSSSESFTCSLPVLEMHKSKQ